ncbi:MAG: hypothetical protein MJ184_06495 [Treponema sp.]|uniref:hypothetical protein n=1 Tax=Treponema sp. TaxID=166 RepID=UPI00298E74C7|nr:hypothetical protein [Treponema sp.]MCQ2600993.1 hypothetical protein [Treponema sp.]
MKDNMENKTESLYVQIKPETRMTEEQFNSEIDKGYLSILRGETVSTEDAFDKIKRRS